MDLGNLNWSVEVDTSDLSRAESEMEGTREAATGARRATEGIGTGATRAGRQTRTATQRMQRDMQRVRRSTDMLRNAIGGLVTALGAREIIRYADAWQSVENQLRMVTDSTQELERVQSQIVDVSRETRSNFSATGNLYARLARSTTELGLEQSDLLELTRTINQSFAVSGATAEEASAAITQLSQGLAAGALRGDEFNSVSEQAPAIMRAISESLDMTIGDLRDFAAEGGITAEIVVNALQEASDSIANDFAGSIATFGQQLEVSRTNLIEWVGNSEEARGAIAGLGNTLVALSGNLDAIVSVSKVIATLYAGRLAQALYASVAAKIAANGAAITLTGSLRTLRTVSMSMFGPAGIIAAGVVALGEIGRAFDDSAEKAKRMEFRANELAESLQAMGETSIRTQLAAITLELAQMDGAQEALEEQNKRNINSTSVLGAEFSNLHDQIQTTVMAQRHGREEHAQMRTQQMALEQALKLVTESGSAASKEIEEYGGAASSASEDSKKAAAEAEKLAQSYQSIVDRIRPLQAAQRKYAEEKSTLVEYALRENMANAELVSLLDDLDRSYRSTRTVAEAYGEAGVKANEDIAKAADDIGFAFESAFESAILQGEGFRDVLQGILDDILQIALRTAVTEPLGQAIGGAVGGLFGGSPIAGGFTTQVDTGAGFAGAFDNGGSIGSGQWGIVGERGPEIVSGPAMVTSRADTAKQMGGEVQVNVYAPEGSDVRTEERQTPGGRSIDVIIDETVARNIGNPGSRTGRALKNNFGSQRTLTGRG